MSAQRDLYKIEAILKRGGFPENGQYPLCDFCHTRIGNHMHELIARSVTQGNKEARELSFQGELVSLLCPICHEDADSEDMAAYLWAFNRSLWGPEFDLALERLQAVMTTRIISF